MSGGADRAAIAREVLSSADYQAHIGKALKSLGKAWPVLSDHASHIDGEFSNALDDVKRLAELVADAHPAAPPAPVTVTVENVEWTLHPDLGWVVTDDDSPPNKADAIEFLNRIAADACVLGEKEARISELTGQAMDLSVELQIAQKERDAALRALEEKDAADAGSTAETMAGISRGSKPWASESRNAATPIPLGAVVDGYTRESSGWRGGGLGVFIRDDSNDRSPLLTALYHARRERDQAREWAQHAEAQRAKLQARLDAAPVATRETVERVARSVNDERAVLTWSLLNEKERDHWRNIARAALGALGYTIQEGV